MRFNELLGGSVTDVAVSVYGDRPGASCVGIAEAVAAVVAREPGAVDVRVHRAARRSRSSRCGRARWTASRAGFTVREVLDAVQAIRTGVRGGRHLRRRRCASRSCSGWATPPSAFTLADLAIPAAAGGLVPLSRVADVALHHRAEPRPAAGRRAAAGGRLQRARRRPRHGGAGRRARGRGRRCSCRAATVSCGAASTRRSSARGARLLRGHPGGAGAHRGACSSSPSGGSGRPLIIFTQRAVRLAWAACSRSALRGMPVSHLGGGRLHRALRHRGAERRGAHVAPARAGGGGARARRGGRALAARGAGAAGADDGAGGSARLRADGARQRRRAPRCSGRSPRWSCGGLGDVDRC